MEQAGGLLLRQGRPEGGDDLLLAQRTAVAEEEEEHLLALLAPPLQVRHLAPVHLDAQVAEGEPGRSRRRSLFVGALFAGGGGCRGALYRLQDAGVVAVRQLVCGGVLDEKGRPGGLQMEEVVVAQLLHELRRALQALQGHSLSLEREVGLSKVEVRLGQLPLRIAFLQEGYRALQGGGGFLELAPFALDEAE